VFKHNVGTFKVLGRLQSIYQLARWPKDNASDCGARGPGFDFQLRQICSLVFHKHIYVNIYYKKVSLLTVPRR